MRTIGILSLALALVILVAVLAMYYQGGQGPLPTERGIGSAIAFCLLVAAGFTIVRVTGIQEKLIAELRSSEHRVTEFRDLLQTALYSIGDAVIVTDAKGIITFHQSRSQDNLGLGWRSYRAAAPCGVCRYPPIHRSDSRGSGRGSSAGRQRWGAGKGYRTHV